MSRSSHSSQDSRAPGHPQLVRLAEASRSPVTFYLDGQPVRALAGDTLLTAILTHQRHVRFSEFSGTPRAGFCLIGACQDCWVRCESSPAAAGDAQLSRLRACSTPVQDGMRILTGAVGAGEAHGGSHD
ncbi:(2Fe-2S)-binding protein [Pandoraea bronchicola]|uniref:Hydrogen cyanide synthase subunit HcnA n=1 Tax=Pandoraea bronchicola TaxID=2508287 RepID=A0A5E5BS86_9BURK|nr:(2Fe-2S)-binding protein [Pandoraea bronchicola]VVE87313.1 Hydrogen cyanide synthase subunit HcnA [Pandoraea bronchicola]